MTLVIPRDAEICCENAVLQNFRVYQAETTWANRFKESSFPRRMYNFLCEVILECFGIN